MGLIIDVQRDCRQVFKDIVKCKYILSSSLHGLVVADSFGISNRWVEITDRVYGKGFKFFDYYSAFKIPEPRPLGISGNETLEQLVSATKKTPDQAEEIRRRLDDAFRTFVQVFRAHQGKNV